MNTMLGDRIKQLRKEKDITQSELAKTLELSISMIGMIETNKREVSNSMLIKIAKLFDVTIDYLLGNSDFKKGRIVTAEEMKDFVPKDFDLNRLQITVDDETLTDEVKEEIVKHLKEKGFIK